MRSSEVLIVGSNNKPTGGIPRYIPEQLRHLPDRVEGRVYDIGAAEGSGTRWFIASLCLALVDAITFPLQRRPDVVHVHTSQKFSFYRASAYVLFASHVWRVPVLLHVHGSSFDEFVSTESSFSRTVQRLVYDASSEIVVLSQYWKRQLEPHADAEKITVLPNAVDPADYEPSYDAEPPHVVFVSNLIERKGVNELVDAVDRLLRDDPEIQVSIAGKGPLSPAVEALADRHELVTYHGYVSEEQKRDLLGEGSIYVLPAYAEGLPIAILEAMAGGNAIVSTTVGSIPEVIGTENGRLVAPKDDRALTSHVRELANDPDTVRSMGRRNRKYIEERYCWDVVTARLVDRYDVLTGRRASSAA
jgi:glycosyltransferase involved in cell wall biosynthesis